MQFLCFYLVCFGIFHGQRIFFNEVYEKGIFKEKEFKKMFCKPLS